MAMVVAAPNYQRRNWRNFAVHAVLILAIAFTLGPLIWMVGLSIKNSVGIFQNPLRPIPLDPTIGNYTDIFRTYNIPRQLFNSVLFSGGVTALQLLLGIPAAYAFARWTFRGEGLLFALMLLSMPIPFVVYYVPNYVLMSDWGLLNTYTGMILPHAVSAYTIFLLRQHFRAFPQPIIEAARLDGASELGLLWRIVIPNTIGAIVALSLINFIATWNEYVWPLLIAPRKEMHTLTVSVGSMTGGEGGSRWGQTMAAAVIASSFTLGAYLIGRKRLLQAMAEGGVK